MNYCQLFTLDGLKNVESLSQPVSLLTPVSLTVTEMSRKGHGKVTERSRKASVGRQGDSIIQPTTHHPTKNFSDTSRGPTPKYYTFLETSHDPLLESQLRCKNFANFFCNPFLQLQNFENFQRPYPQVLYLSLIHISEPTRPY